MIVRKRVAERSKFALRSSRAHEYCQSIAKESTVHGFKYIGSKVLHPVERMFWLFVTLGVFGFGILMIYRVVQKYKLSPIITSFQPEETPISQIPFPAITICNVNMFKRSVMTKLYDDLRVLIKVVLSKGKDPNLDLDVMRSCAHLDHLTQYCLATPSFRRSLTQTLRDAHGRLDFSELLNDIFATDAKIPANFVSQFENDTTWWQEEREIFENATIKCEDMLLKCSWAGTLVPCNQIFFPIDTRNGRCCVFNLIPQFILENFPNDDERLHKELKRIPPSDIQDWKNFVNEDLIVKDLDKLASMNYPKHQKSGGKPFGLSVLVNPELDEYSTCTSNDGWGFKIVAHSPLSAPSVIDYAAAIPPGSEVFVDIEPRIIISDDILQNIAVDYRGCYLASDFPSKVKLNHYKHYSMENCQSECGMEHVYKNCDCVRHYMPRNASQKLCSSKQRECVREVRANLTKGIGKSAFCGHCLPSCTEVQYKLQISHFDMRESNASANFDFVKADGNNDSAMDYAIIHIFMGTDSIYAKERKTLYTGFDLIANAGGLLGLTLGVSIISFIEIIYFCTLRFWFYVRSREPDIE